MAHGDDVLAYIRAHPGITTPEIAQALGLQSGKTYLFAKKLEPYGLVRHETLPTGGRNVKVTYWYPMEVV